MSAKNALAIQRRELSRKELDEFLSSYSIPSEYRVILPMPTQTILDAPLGYIGLYTHCFSLDILRLPLNDFFCEVLQYFKVHISRLNPFGCSKLTTFIVMCKAYDCEPYVELFCSFFNLCKAGWHQRFFFIQDTIVPSKFPQLLLKENMLDVKSFKDKLPSVFMGTWPTATCNLCGRQGNFIYTEDGEDLTFLPKDFSPGFNTGSPSVSINTKPVKAAEEPAVEPTIEPATEPVNEPKRKCKTRGASSRPPVKRKLAFGSLTSCTIRAKAFAIKDDNPVLSISDDDEGLEDCLELKDATACHLKIFAITPPAWKGFLNNHIDVDLLDLYYRCYARQAVVDNAVNRRPQKMYSLAAEAKEHKGNLDRLMLESQKWSSYQEVKHDRREVVSKVAPYACMELFHSGKLDRLVGKLVSSAITFGRCRAYEQVARMKEPFDLSKVKGHHPSYEKEHTQASNDLATVIFSWLNEYVADASASMEALLSKKPLTLQKPVPSRTQMLVPSSHLATQSSAPASKPMSPLADIVKPSQSPNE
nr:hypothetical protein [Tanacetum cinerariifolium]